MLNIILQPASMVIAVALVTLATRAIPFLLFSGKKATPPYILYLGRVLPPAILALLIIYSVKGASWARQPYGLPELLAISFVAALHLWKKNHLLSIGLGTLFYMLMIQKFFPLLLS